MCGIFAYLNFSTQKKRSEIVFILMRGLHQMEYRFYDSAGIAIDGNAPNSDVPVAVYRKKGDLHVLLEHINAEEVYGDAIRNNHCGIGHIRWATHGTICDSNAQPQPSKNSNDFVIVQNGSISNFNEIKNDLENMGCSPFESETDTQLVARLTQILYEQNKQWSLLQIVQNVVQRLEGQFALAVKSGHFPNQLVATQRGCYLLVGIKPKSSLTNDLPVYYYKEEKKGQAGFQSQFCEKTAVGTSSSAQSARPCDAAFEIEYFVASDASSVIEHTRRIIVLEDGDMAFIKDGTLLIDYSSRRSTVSARKNRFDALYFGPAGISNVEDAKSRQEAIHWAKTRMRRAFEVPWAVLEFSVSGINIRDLNDQVLHHYPIGNKLCLDETDVNFFSLIFREGERHFCHVFCVLRAVEVRNIVLSLNDFAMIYELQRDAYYNIS